MCEKVTWKTVSAPGFLDQYGDLDDVFLSEHVTFVIEYDDRASVSVDGGAPRTMTLDAALAVAEDAYPDEEVEGPPFQFPSRAATYGGFAGAVTELHLDGDALRSNPGGVFPVFEKVHHLYLVPPPSDLGVLVGHFPALEFLWVDGPNPGTDMSALEKFEGLDTVAVRVDGPCDLSAFDAAVGVEKKLYLDGDVSVESVEGQVTSLDHLRFKYRGSGDFPAVASVARDVYVHVPRVTPDSFADAVDAAVKTGAAGVLENISMTFYLESSLSELPDFGKFEDVPYMVNASVFGAPPDPKYRVTVFHTPLKMSKELEALIARLCPDGFDRSDPQDDDDGR